MTRTAASAAKKKARPAGAISIHIMKENSPSIAVLIIGGFPSCSCHPAGNFCRDEGVLCPCNRSAETEVEERKLNVENSC
jgi:hypothetical protein